MPWRVVIAVLAVAVAVAGSAAATSRPALVYQLRPDQRMCPSPVCGGFWVRAVNLPTTVCFDGTRQPWCYVAEVDPAIARGATGQLLVRGWIVPAHRSVGGSFGRLQPAAGSSIRQATGTSPWDGTGAVYLVKDTGVRCVRAPCFSFSAARVNTKQTQTVSSIVSPVGAGGHLRSPQGVLVVATVRHEPAGGRALVVRQVFL